MRPAVGVSMVAMQLSNVLLPEPDGPMIPTYSPASTRKLTSSRASVEDPSLFAFVPYRLEMLLTSSNPWCAICVPFFDRLR